MTVYYVRPDGNNNNAGTGPSTGEAWATLSKAAEVMVAGDVCYVAPGSYGETLSLANHGLIDAPIEFIADEEAEHFTDMSAGEANLGGAVGTTTTILLIDNDGEWLKLNRLHIKRNRTEERPVRNRAPMYMKDIQFEDLRNLRYTAIQLRDVYGNFTFRDCTTHSLNTSAIIGATVSGCGLYGGPFQFKDSIQIRDSNLISGYDVVEGLLLDNTYGVTDNDNAILVNGLSVARNWVIAGTPTLANTIASSPSTDVPVVFEKCRFQNLVTNRDGLVTTSDSRIRAVFKDCIIDNVRSSASSSDNRWSNHVFRLSVFENCRMINVRNTRHTENRGFGGCIFINCILTRGADGDIPYNCMAIGGTLVIGFNPEVVSGAVVHSEVIANEFWEGTFASINVGLENEEPLFEGRSLKLTVYGAIRHDLKIPVEANRNVIVKLKAKYFPHTIPDPVTVKFKFKNTTVVMEKHDDNLNIQDVEFSEIFTEEELNGTRGFVPLQILAYTENLEQESYLLIDNVEVL